MYILSLIAAGMLVFAARQSLLAWFFRREKIYLHPTTGKPLPHVSEMDRLRFAAVTSLSKFSCVFGIIVNALTTSFLAFVVEDRPSDLEILFAAVGMTFISSGMWYLEESKNFWDNKEKLLEWSEFWSQEVGHR